MGFLPLLALKASHNLSPPGLLPFSLFETTVHNPLSSPFPLPHLSHLLLLILCQQLASKQCQIKQMCIVLVGTDYQALCLALSLIKVSQLSEGGESPLDMAGSAAEK